MVKLILSNFRCRTVSYIVVCVELVILLIVCNVLLNQLIPFIQGEHLYKEMDLSSIVCCTSNVDRATVERHADKVGATVLWRNYRTQYISDDSELQIKPVEKAYLQHFGFADDALAGIQAVVPYSLSGQYKEGGSYSVHINGIGEITFAIAKVLNTDLMFLPPANDTVSSIIGSYPTTIILAMDEENLSNFTASDIYTLQAADAQAVALGLSWYDGIITAMSCEDAKTHNNSLELSQMGMPIIISITAVILCLAGMLSNTLLTIIANERTNGIYYICGYTWRKCAMVQIVSDFLVVIAAILAALGVMLLISKISSGYVALQKIPFIASILIVVTIYTVTEMMGILQIQKNNVAEIVERMK